MAFLFDSSSSTTIKQSQTHVLLTAGSMNESDDGTKTPRVTTEHQNPAQALQRSTSANQNQSAMAITTQQRHARSPASAANNAAAGSSTQAAVALLHQMTGSASATVATLATHHQLLMAQAEAQQRQVMELLQRTGNTSGLTGGDGVSAGRGGGGGGSDGSLLHQFQLQQRFSQTLRAQQQAAAAVASSLISTGPQTAGSLISTGPQTAGSLQTGPSPTLQLPPPQSQSQSPQPTQPTQQDWQRQRISVQTQQPTSHAALGSQILAGSSPIVTHQLGAGLLTTTAFGLPGQSSHLVVPSFQGVVERHGSEGVDAAGAQHGISMAGMPQDWISTQVWAQDGSVANTEPHGGSQSAQLGTRWMETDTTQQQHAPLQRPLSRSGQWTQPLQQQVYVQQVEDSVDGSGAIGQRGWGSSLDMMMLGAGHPVPSPAQHGLRSIAAQPTSSNLSGSVLVGYGSGVELYPPAETTNAAVLADRDLFMATLKRLHEAMGSRFRVPVVGGQELDLWLLYKQVVACDGLSTVVQLKRHYEQVYMHRTTGPLLAAPVPEAPAPPAPISMSGASKRRALERNASVPGPEGMAGVWQAYASAQLDASAGPAPVGNLGPSSAPALLPAGAPPSFIGMQTDKDRGSPGLDDVAVGAPVQGVVTQRFDYGLFVQLQVGGMVFRGALYAPPATASHSVTPSGAAVEVPVRVTDVSGPSSAEAQYQQPTNTNIQAATTDPAQQQHMWTDAGGQPQQQQQQQGQAGVATMMAGASVGLGSVPGAVREGYGTSGGVHHGHMLSSSMSPFDRHSLSDI